MRTPQIYDKSLWETSGHWEKYREHMFTFQSENREFGLKPMNCPGHCGALLGRRLQLPRAAAAASPRPACSTATSWPGALHGLLRVRMFSQDDAHIFCTPEQIEDEVLGCLDFGYAIYDRLGLEILVELSTRPENKLGTDEEWDAAEAALAAGARAARARVHGRTRATARSTARRSTCTCSTRSAASWQIGTVQLDFQMPQRFGLRYQGADNAEHTPGDDPPGADRLVRALHRHPDRALRRRVPVLARAGAGARDPGRRDRTASAARALAAKLAPYRVEVDESDETVGKKIRNAEIEKIPFVIVYGDKESDESLAIREHGGGQSTRSLAELRESLATLTP